MKTFWEKEKERKKMKKKAVSLLMVAAMMTTMAAGCGNKAANNAGSDAAADNSTTSDAAAEETAGTEAAAVDTAGTEAAAADSEDEPWSGTITVWSPQEDQDTGWLAKECDAFNAAHPNWDITFNYGVCAEGDAKATVTQDVENSADVYMLANDNIPSMQSIYNPEDAISNPLLCNFSHLLCHLNFHHQLPIDTNGHNQFQHPQKSNFRHSTEDHNYIHPYLRKILYS